jgi:hypothetical protein
MVPITQRMLAQFLLDRFQNFSMDCKAPDNPTDTDDGLVLPCRQEWF